MVKLTDRCFCCFTAAMLVPLGRAPTWRFHTKLYKFGWNIFPNNAQMKNRTELNLGKVFYVWLIYHIPGSWLKDVRTHCYCASLLRTPFIKHARATSFSSARTESKTQQKHRAGDLGVNLVCQYFCWILGGPQFFFGRSFPFPILSIILKNKKNLCVGSFKVPMK